ncbi:GDP/GTP exchange factor for ARF [Tulasnella sp. 330]|nr:GDP/GTP exchange factor for ARF [Tulasnella sp. 330]
MAQDATNVSQESRLSVSNRHLVFYEIIAVTTAMRRNSRWASAQPGLSRGTSLASSMGLRPPSGGNESSNNANQNKHEVALMVGFDELKRTLHDTEDIQSLPLTTLLNPFLAIIRSPLSTGPITSTALASLLNFFVSGIINPTSPDVSSALVTMSNALAHCKFERSDSAGDEVVLLRIVNVIDECQASAVGEMLGDVEICEMLETVLTICCQMRLSETLRRCAESAMYAMVRRVFARLDSLDPALDTEDAEEPQASTPYGLPSAQELVRVLVNLLDPNDNQHTDSIRLTTLGILNAALERSGSRMAQFRSLSSILVDSGCKYLFQLARSENPTVLRWALRVIATLSQTMRSHLKLQTELFLSFSVDRLSPPMHSLPPKVQLSLNSSGQNRRNASLPGTPVIDSSFSNSPGDPSQDPLMLDSSAKEEPAPPSRPGIVPAKGLTRELLLETIGYFARQPTFMVDMWVNYDCDVDCEDLFERLLGFFTRGVYANHYVGSLESQRYSAQLISLDVLLSYVNYMAARAENLVHEWPETFPQPESLTVAKSSKGLLLTGATRFNIKPKTGLAYLEENGLLYRPEDKDVPRARSLAKFLKSTPRLNKKVLGDWISAPDQIDVLTEFIGLFDFTGKSVADGLRLLLESFRLPGEAGPIARITEVFADAFFASKPPEVRSKDAVYVLSYSVIMLNTDLYNPQNRKRMTFEDYQKNLRGVNDGTNFEPAYLQSIYESIKKREIVLPEEHSGSLGFDYAWTALLSRSKAAGPLITCQTSHFDRAMFQQTWRSVISAIAYAFTAFDDDYVVERAIAGFRKCATLASHFQLPEVFDYIVRSLSHATGLLSEDDIKSSKFPVVQVEGTSLTISPLSVRFGTNFRGQLAAVVLFTIANGNGDAIREGWMLIFEMFQTLFIHSLLPQKMLQMEDFLGGASAIPMQGAPPATPIARPEGGLLSALSSYLLTPYGASSDSLGPEPTQDDIENTLCTMDCVSSCKVDELYSQIMSLRVDALVAVLRALQTLADRRTVDILVDEIITDPALPNDARQELSKEQLPYDPTSVFLLEIMISTVRQTTQHIEETWPIVFDHLSGILKASERFSVLLIERAVVGLLRLCLIIAEKPILHDQIYIAIDLLRGLPPSVMNLVAEQLSAGLALLLKEHNIMRSSTEWGLVLSLIRGTVAHPEAAKNSFRLLQELLTAENRQVVTSDNFSGFVSLIESFASAAGLAVDGQRQDRRNVTPAANLEPVITRGTRAIDMLSDLRKFVPGFITQSSLAKDEAWKNFWTTLLSALSRQSASSCREVRHLAIGHLQRLLLGPQISGSAPGPVDFRLLLDRIVLPMMEDLLKPQVYVRDPQGMSETRLRASTLLCKSFLHFSVHSAEDIEATGKVWLDMLDMLDRFMHSGKRDQLFEAVPESLKNVVLVMNASGILVRPGSDASTPSQAELWKSTHERMEKFLPGFLDELIPSAPPEGVGLGSGIEVVAPQVA